MKRAAKRKWPATVVLVSLLPALTYGDVNIRLAETTITQDKPVQVTFEASGPSVSLPDLTPLQTDFEILNRSVQQRSSTINGRRTQWTTLSLTLRAKRAGNLEIPTLQFGGETSRPQAIRVLVGAESSAPSSLPQSQGFAPWDSPGPRDPFGMQTPQFGSPWGGSNLGFPPSSMGGSPQSGASGIPLPPPTPRDTSVFGVQRPLPQDSASQPQYTPATGEATPSAEGNLGNTWSWIAGFAAAGWLGTLFLCWLRRRWRLAHDLNPSSVQAPSPHSPQPEPESEETKALGAIAAAYSRGDAGGAREALLAWAKRVWPANPPGNLSRLAGRLAEPLRGYVLELDEALYSPTPIPWEKRPVAELLRSFPT